LFVNKKINIRSKERIVEFNINFMADLGQKLIVLQIFKYKYKK